MQFVIVFFQSFNVFFVLVNQQTFERQIINSTQKKLKTQSKNQRFFGSILLPKSILSISKSLKYDHNLSRLVKFQLEMHVFDIHKWVLGTWITSTLLLLRSASWAQLTAALKKPVLYSSAPPPNERQSLPYAFFVNEWQWPPFQSLLKQLI